MEFNKDELNAPAWLQADFFKEVLLSCKNGNISRIQEVKITPATLKGDHYASVMFRGFVRYLDKKNVENEISLIVKTMPEEDGTKKDLLKDCYVFETEIQIYRDVIPKFESMLRAIGDQTVLGAKMLYYTLEPRKLIVFEDITKKGFFSLGNRGLSVEEAKLCLEKLAKWHAASYKFNSEPDTSIPPLKSFVHGVLNMPGGVNNDVFCSGIDQVIGLLENLPGYEKYIPKLQKINEKLTKKCQQTYEMCQSGGGLNVLNHGDFHPKNLMYEFDANGIAKDVMMVDFQLSVWGSMAIDVLYWSYMLIDVETRKAHMDELRYEFFNMFLETLQALGFKGKLPRYTDLQIELVKMNHLELFLVTTFLPFMHCISSGMEMDPALLMDSADYRLKMYRLPSYIEEIKTLLPVLLYKGYLEEYDIE